MTGSSWRCPAARTAGRCFTILNALRQRAPVSFSLVAVTVHPGFPGFRTDGIVDYLRAQGYEHRIVHAPVHDLILEKLDPDETPCCLCSRIKRGTLYTAATELGCTQDRPGPSSGRFHRDPAPEPVL